ncbi:MAG: hypothetical protein A2W22_00115 [Candidatus Levybacteria bacterium RBG_16_35_11]|nr:MAG: hypothetical protein A2W22_00115 [Candidatus Levybacteria bacterium RBG_16_35_11]
MRAPELDLSHFPRKPHDPLIRPANRLSDEVINEYAGISGGRMELMTQLLAEDFGYTLLEPWAVLSKDKEIKSITFVYPSSPEKNGLMEIIGTKIENGNLIEIHETVDPKNLNTESTGITEEMILASERACRVQ